MAIKDNPEVLKPILVTGMGRSGSTLAMQLLGTDPNCVFDEVYPLESRYLSLITHFAAQWRGWTFADYGQTASAYQAILGTNPVVVRKDADQDKLLHIPQGDEVLMAMWKQFSQSVRTGKPNAKFYAEKVVEWLPSFLAPTMDCYALYLFRDPRDLFLSANKFNEKRGYLAFGREQRDSDRDHALTLAYRYLHRYENYKAFKAAGGHTSLIRYEDMALNPIPTLSHLIETTGIQIHPLKDDKSFSQHRTSGSIEQSVARWKREPIDQSVLDIFDEVLFEVMTEMGYETNRPATAEKFNFNFSANDGDQLKSRISKIENASLANVSDAGLTFNCESPEVSFVVNLDETKTSDVSEIWIVLSGAFGGQATMGWASPSSDFVFSQASEFLKSYDPGPHCTTLRFIVRNEDSFQGSLDKLFFKVTNKAAQAQGNACNVRAIKLISRPPTLADEQATEESPAKKSKGFLSQLLGTSKDK